MKEKLVAAMLGFAFSVPCFAVNWYVTSVSKVGMTLINTQSISTAGSYKQAEITEVLSNTSQGFDVVVTGVRIDCGGMKGMGLWNAFYSKGKLLAKQETHATKMGPFRKGSIGWGFATAVCNGPDSEHNLGYHGSDYGDLAKEGRRIWKILNERYPLPG